MYTIKTLYTFYSQGQDILEYKGLQWKDLRNWYLAQVSNVAIYLYSYIKLHAKFCM